MLFRSRPSDVKDVEALELWFLPRVSTLAEGLEQDSSTAAVAKRLARLENQVGIWFSGALLCYFQALVFVEG